MIFLQNISKQFENVSALKKVDIQIAQNSIFALLGPNGAGKTTLLRIITSIFAPDSGTYFYNNKEVGSNYKPKIGYLPEERGLYKKMRVDEHLIYLAQLRGMTFTEAKNTMQYWLQKLKIADRQHQKVEQLSKGLQQKVQFIATVIHNPDVIILDEPFTGFDPINAELIKNEILELKQQGKTIIISTHRMESVEELCDEMALLNKGEIVLTGNIATIKKTYSKNTFLIKGIGAVSKLNNGQILSAKRINNTTELLIKINDNQIVNNVIMELIAAGIEIQFVEEQLPSMHDIFIEKIKENAE